MSNNTITPLSSTLGLVSGILKLRESAVMLQRQLTTGKISDTYAGLGASRTLVLSSRAMLSRLDAYQTSAQDIGFRLDVMQLSLGRVQNLAVDAKSQIRGAGYDLNGTGQTSGQVFARASLGEALSLLNTEVAGRYIYGGKAVDREPVVNVDLLLNGQGAQAGFTQVMNERYAADSGADGLGRMEITAPALNTIRLEEDGAHPFGLKLNAVTTTSAGVNITANITPGNGTQDDVEIEFAAQPNAGDVVRLSFVQPDGSIRDVELRATATGLEPNSFQIGADADETAANFQAALEGSVERLVATDMAAASNTEAANNFYGNPPMRLDDTGNPAAATALVAGDETNTVIWYLGEDDGSDPRETAQGFIGRNRKVSYGARANEPAFVEVLKGLSVVAANTFDVDVASDKQRYEATMTKAADRLSFTNGQQSINSIIADVASLQAFVGQSKAFNQSEINLATEVVADRESVDINEVAVKLAQVQTSLQAAYSATAIVSQLTLVNYL